MSDAVWLKRIAAEQAALLVEDGMRLGLGSGTTAEEFVRALEPRLKAGLRLEGVASSERTAAIAIQVGLHLVALTGTLDLAVDGADAIERRSLAAIKGLGGALTREKLVAEASQRFVLISDDSKLVDHLSDAVSRVPIPVEVLEFGWQTTQGRLDEFGEPVLRTRNGEPFITDNGNVILDLFVETLPDPATFGETLHGMTGVVEHGLFIGLASSAIIGTPSGAIEICCDS